MTVLTLGDFELTAVSDGTYHLDGGVFFGVVPKLMWEKKISVDQKNRVATGLNSVVVRTGEHTILIETAIGNKLPEKMAQIYGQPAKLLDDLSAARISPEDIDIVINTHLHFDHCGWNTVQRGGRIVATFPKAAYYVQRGEWEHACRQHERDRVSYLSPNYAPLVETGQMRLLQGDQEIAPGISVKVFPGHTRDMQAVIIRSGGKTACYISDLIPTTAHLDLVWTTGFDLFPLETIDNRKRYYAQAIPGSWLTIFTHETGLPWAYLENNEKGKLSARPA
jgi:glyoxylase-like metal-dependent hydrolase (beta-lactamase superfamily II)